MSKSIKRSIIVDGNQYFWVLNGNRIDSKETHIRVYKEGTTGNILYIDPYNWHFEIRPKFIADAIKYALSIGWTKPDSKAGIYICYDDHQYQVLPKGLKFGYEQKKIK